MVDHYITLPCETTQRSREDPGAGGPITPCVLAPVPLTGIYRDGPLIQDALATAHQQAERDRPALDERRQAIAAEITRTERSTARYFDAFEEGRLSPERCAATR